MRTKYAREIRYGINLAKQVYRKERVGPPSSAIWNPERLWEEAYSRTWMKFEHKPPKSHGVGANLPRGKFWRKIFGE